MHIVPFIPAHLEGFQEQEWQKDFAGLFKNAAYVDMLAREGGGISGIVDGRAMAIAGVMPLYEHIGLAWALIDKRAGPYMLPITRAVRADLEERFYPRIEIHVLRGFEQAHRWAKMLGFVNETPGEGMKNFGMNGETCDLYARYK